jgi:phage major head subunit gpT-like protein
MDINQASLSILFTEIDTAAKNAFASATEKQIFELCSMKVPSRSATQLHAWMNQIPKIRQWLGDRQIKNISTGVLNIPNRKFEETIEMERTVIEDDMYGIYSNLAAAMGAQAAVFPDVLCVETLCTNDIWQADNAAFYGTTRRYTDPNDATNYSEINNYTTDSLSAASFNTAYKLMTSYTGHGGLPLEVKPVALVHGPALRTTAFDILKNEFLAGAVNANGATSRNPNQNLVMPIESQRLVGANAYKWFLVGEAAGGIRGLVYQERMAAEFQRSRLDLNSDYVFLTDKFQYGVRIRGEAFKLFPHLIYGGFASS